MIFAHQKDYYNLLFIFRVHEFATLNFYASQLYMNETSIAV